MLLIVMDSEVEWCWKKQNRQKLVVPFLCGKNLWRLRPSPIDRPDGGMAGLPPGSAGGHLTSVYAETVGSRCKMILERHNEFIIIVVIIFIQRLYSTYAFYNVIAGASHSQSNNNG